MRVWDVGYGDAYVIAEDRADAEAVFQDYHGSTVRQEEVRMVLLRKPVQFCDWDGNDTECMSPREMVDRFGRGYHKFPEP